MSIWRDDPLAGTCRTAANQRLGRILADFGIGCLDGLHWVDDDIDGWLGADPLFLSGLCDRLFRRHAVQTVRYGLDSR